MSVIRETSFISAVVDLAPVEAGRRFDAWAGRLIASQASTCPEGHVVLALSESSSTDVPRWAVRRAQGQLRGARRSWGAISLELSAWSDHRTELGIRQIGNTQLSPQYYAIGHTALTELENALKADDQAPPARMFRAVVAPRALRKESVLVRASRLPALSR